MTRHKWIIGIRNKLAEFHGECDSCAAINGAKMTRREREELQSLIRKARDYIDNKLGF